MTRIFICLLALILVDPGIGHGQDQGYRKPPGGAR